MNIEQILAQLRSERDRIDQALCNDEKWYRQEDNTYYECTGIVIQEYRER